MHASLHIILLFSLGTFIDAFPILFSQMKKVPVLYKVMNVHLIYYAVKNTCYITFSKLSNEKAHDDALYSRLTDQSCSCRGVAGTYWAGNSIKMVQPVCTIK